jgi:16S rRNA (guanine966-N2)-methyltransferase
MKIISGTLKGRSIITTKDNMYRPTTGMVKEAIFSILSSGSFINEETGEPILKDAITIDLFGGTGALTFESISRGSAKGIIIEKDIYNFKTLETNAKKLGIQSQIQIIKSDATNLPKAPSDVAGKCNIVFIDPPFNKNLILEPILQLAHKNWLSPRALIIIESHDKEEYKLEASYELLFSRKYGKSILNIYKT